MNPVSRVIASFVLLLWGSSPARAQEPIAEVTLDGIGLGWKRQRVEALLQQRHLLPLNPTAPKTIYTPRGEAFCVKYGPTVGYDLSQGVEEILGQVLSVGKKSISHRDGLAALFQQLGQENFARVRCELNDEYFVSRTYRLLVKASRREYGVYPLLQNYFSPEELREDDPSLDHQSIQYFRLCSRMDRLFHDFSWW